MTPTPSILIYGHDATLLDTRRWVLEKAGFKVSTTSALPIVLAAMTQQAPDLFVLCHTLTRNECNAIMAAAAKRQPVIRTLTFCTNCQARNADGIRGESLDNFAGAERLIAAAHRLVQGRME